MFVERSEDLWGAIADIAAAEGVAIYDLERVPNGLRLSIDRVEQVSSSEGADLGEEIEARPERVTSEDCSTMVRRLMSYFSVEGNNFGVGLEPFIEVSSPGVNRQLRVPEHFESALGQRVKVSYVESEDDPTRRKGIATLRGILKARDAVGIVLHPENSETELHIPFGKLKRAQIDFDFDAPRAMKRARG